MACFHVLLEDEIRSGLRPVEQIRQIVELLAPQGKLALIDDPETSIGDLMAFVQSVRKMELQKRPGIAETLDWTAALLRLDIAVIDPAPFAPGPARSRSLGRSVKTTFGSGGLSSRFSMSPTRSSPASPSATA
mgnify:CR=1 FL=1